MKTPPCHRCPGVLIALMLVAASARANPIELPEKSIAPEISGLIGCAILIEVICLWGMLRRFRRPRFLVVWLLGMHVFTYPAFLDLLWELYDVRPAFAVAFGEGLVVVVEGALVYLMCRFLPATKPGLTTPSMVRCWVASLIGNGCSAAAFPVLCKLFG
jgi:hypothetical protein